MSTALWTRAILWAALLYATQATAADEQVLYAFCSLANCADGENPYSPLIADRAGNLYGTTVAGGAYGLGVVFKLTATGQETVLHSFRGGADGAAPYGGLIFDSSGDILGTTSNGGGSRQCGKEVGCGTVFRLAPDGTETVLHAFCLKGRICRDGIAPYAGVTLDAAGNIYGTTQFGSIDTALDNGIVFKLTPDGKERIVWSFGGGGDTAHPIGGVFLDGNFGILGTGSTDPHDCGGCRAAIYRLQPNGFETLLHRFPLGNPVPESDLTSDGDGHFYGTTANSGDPGTVYELTLPKHIKVLHRFGGNGTDGFEEHSGVSYYAGNLYGVSVGGGGSVIYKGTIFQLTLSGVETILHRFTGSPDGDSPDATPIVVRGNLYGTTVLGGTAGCGGRGCGVVFRYGPI